MALELQAPTAGRPTTLAGKHLTFTLQHECFGIDVLQVREIIRLTNITAVPQMPDWVRGVINPHGKIISVVDLRRRFGFADAANAEQNCIVVVQATSPSGQATAMGLVVDAVEEVAQFATADIEETPDFESHIAIGCLLGTARIKGAVKALLSIDKAIVGACATALG